MTAPTLNVSCTSLLLRRFLLLSGLLLILLSPGAPTQAAPQLDRIEPHVARISNYRKDEVNPLLGTGFWIRGLPYLITNNHVIADYNTIQVLPAKSSIRYAATVYYSDPVHDLALLKVEGMPVLGSPPAGLVLSPRAQEELPKGMRVWALGYPGAADRGFSDENASEATLTAGIINRTLHQPWESGQRFLLIQHDAKLSHGNSGGPLLDDCGHVIGINTQIQLATVALETYSYALSAFEIKQLLDSHPSLDTSGWSSLDIARTCAPENVTTVLPTEWIWLGGLLSSLVALMSLFMLLMRRPQVLHVVESYSRYLRRTQGDVPKGPVQPSSDEATHVWTTLNLRREGDVPILLRSPTAQRTTFTIGRSHRQADYFLDDKTVSRCHVRVAWEPRLRYWTVEDLHSRNGTRLDSKLLLPYQQMPLKQDMQLSIGKVLFTVQLVSGAAHLATSLGGALSQEAANQSQIDLPPITGHDRPDPVSPDPFVVVPTNANGAQDPSTAAPFEAVAAESRGAPASDEPSTDAPRPS